MRSACRMAGALSVLVLLGSTDAAEAAGKGWLEKLSGPGPFSGREWPTVPLWCFRSDDASHGAPYFCQNYQTLERGVIVSFTFSENYKSQRNPLPYDPENTANKTVHLSSYVVSLDLRLHAGLDVGMGLGVSHFSGDAFQSFDRFSFDPLRVVFRPVALLFPKGYVGSGKVKFSVRDLVQVKLRAALFPQGFDANDFGATGDFDEPDELLFGCSVGFGVVVWW